MKILSIFTIFLLLFFSGMAIYFNDFVYQSSHSSITWPILIALIAGAGLSVSYSFYSLSSKSGSFWKWLIPGVAITFFLFFGLNEVEKNLTDNFWKKNNAPELFSALRDHVGVYSGRTVQHWWNRSVLPVQMGNIQEFRERVHFRILHFIFLEKNNLLGCAADLDPVDCRVKWMSAFADHGKWDYDTRLFFYQDVWSVYQQSNKLESLLGYVLKDQELESEKPSILRQLGFDDELADRFLLIQQEEELKSLKLTARIFQEAGLLMQKAGGGPTPNSIKVKDLYLDSEERLKKIPEIEKDIERLRSGKTPAEELPTH